jgi:hypothetical protein
MAVRDDVRTHVDEGIDVDDSAALLVVDAFFDDGENVGDEKGLEDGGQGDVGGGFDVVLRAVDGHLGVQGYRGGWVGGL